LRALGLRGINDTNLQPDKPSTWGAIGRVPHLVEVEWIVMGTKEAHHVAPEFHKSPLESGVTLAERPVSYPLGPEKEPVGWIFRPSEAEWIKVEPVLIAWRSTGRLRFTAQSMHLT
jgi:hypothetical protein